MIVDSSAILAIALNEPERDRLASAIVEAPECHISTLNWLETMIVIESRAGIGGADDARALLSDLGVRTIAFDAAHMQEAQEAWRRYGKGRHRAALNLADCCAYATSRLEGRPLLFKGNDFEETDVEKAVW